MTTSSVRIGTTSTPRVRKQLGILAANTGMVEGMLSGMEASGSKRGEFYLPSRHLLYATQVVTLDLCPSVIKLIRDQPIAQGTFPLARHAPQRGRPSAIACRDCSARHEQPPDGTVALFGDGAELLFAAAGILPRRRSEPG